MKTRVRLGALLALAAAALLAGCADVGSRASGSGREAALTSTSPATVTTSLAAGVRNPATSRGDLPRDQVKVVIQGTVQEGVEPQCRLLETGKGQRWLLVGGGDAGKLVPGARVEVVGVQAPGEPSYCQQGRPLQVLSVKALP
jgi:hypothetical protein